MPHTVCYTGCRAAATDYFNAYSMESMLQTNSDSLQYLGWDDTHMGSTEPLHANWQSLHSPTVSADRVSAAKVPGRLCLSTDRRNGLTVARTANTYLRSRGSMRTLPPTQHSQAPSGQWGRPVPLTGTP